MSNNTILQNHFTCQDLVLEDYSKADINYETVANLNVINNWKDPKPELNKTKSELVFLDSDIGRIERSCRLDSLYVLISPNHTSPALCELQGVYYKLLLELGCTVDQIERMKDLVTVINPPDGLVFRAAERLLLGMPLEGTFTVGAFLHFL